MATSTLQANVEIPHSAEEPGSLIPAGSEASSSEGALVIEIPRRPAALGFSSEDVKSPALLSPTLSRLRSMRRILSREKRAPGPCCVAPGDIEQGTMYSEGGAESLSLR